MPTPMTEEDLQEFWARILYEMGLTLPFDLEQFREGVSLYRGRLLTISEHDLGATVALGHLARHHDRDAIYSDTGAPSPQRLRVCFHEAAHLLLGHLDHLESGAALVCGSFARPDVDIDSWLLYPDHVEREAETSARILTRMSGSRSRPNALPVTARAADRGVAATFGLVTAKTL